MEIRIPLIHLITIIKMMNVVEQVLSSYEKIRDYIRKTPLEYSPYLSNLCNCKVFLKLENYQLTNSFKIRGAFSKLLSYSNANEFTFVTASTGNHGSAVAYALNILKLKGKIFLPTTADKAKINKIKELGAEIELYGEDSVETEIYARTFSESNNGIFVSPYNDPLIIAGQGTIGVELEQQLKEIDYLFAPIGGGGLISGVGGYLKEKGYNSTKVVGCQPVNSPVMYESIRAGKIIDYHSYPTISDGTAGGIEKNSITFEYCKKYVDDYVLIDENEIINAIKTIFREHFMIIEGAAALTVGALMNYNKRELKNKTVVLILSGGKLGEETLKNIFCTR